MIIKGRARGRSRQLAAHLLRRDQNEDIRLYELRGVVAGDVAGALMELEALTASVHSKRPLYHASISPEAHTPFRHEQIGIAADTLERRLGLCGQPRVVVIHRKDGREHLHVVWSRIDLEGRRVISDAWSYYAHEEAARELEAEFGHRAVRGVHAPPSLAPRPRRAPKDYEYRQAERSGKSPAEVSAELLALWQASPDASAFRKKLEEAGYMLARGDRRVFVVIDRAGNAHSLARRLGMRSRDLTARLAGLSLGSLPSVAEARAVGRRRTHAPIAVERFRKAARYVTRRSPPKASYRTRADHAVRLAGAAFARITEPFEARAPVALIVLSRGRRKLRPADYRSKRAIVITEFAAKIANAISHTPRDDVEAALGRLYAEQRAALDALSREIVVVARPRRRASPRPRKRRFARIKQTV